MSQVSDKELYSALGSLFERFNQQTERRLGEQILLLEYKLRCASAFRDPKLSALTHVELGREVSKMIKVYKFTLRRYRKTCFIGKLRILWHRFNR